jgi:ubiquitin carboxyl-terminal hydrolase 9/13
VDSASQNFPPPQANPPPPATASVRPKPQRKYSVAGLATDAPLLTNGTLPVVYPPIPKSPPTLLSALRSLFLFISKHPEDKGVVAPRAFIDKLKEVNELFRSTMHQDAHEFLNYLLNKVAEDIEDEKRQGGTLPGDDCGCKQSSHVYPRVKSRCFSSVKFGRNPGI